MLPSATPTSLSTPNTNPFYIRFIAGNIRICQGCRSILRCADGSVPAPPFDLCVARAERHSFRDATGILRTPQKEQPAHYHLNILCIRAVATDFVPSSIVVPPDVWVKFTKNSCVLFLDSLLDMLLLFVSCFATTNWPQFVVQFIVARTRLLEVDEDDSTLSPVQNSVQNSVQKSSPESRVQPRINNPVESPAVSSREFYLHDDVTFSPDFDSTVAHACV